MALRLLGAVSLAGVALVLAPSAAVADDPGTDLSITLGLFTAPEDAWLPQTEVGSLPSITIRDRFVLRYSVANVGPEAATTVTIVEDAPPPGSYRPGRPASGAWDARCNGVRLNLGWELSCPAGVAPWLHVYFIGDAPGVFRVTATVTSTTSDPNPSNNSVTWETDVGCSIAGTDGDDVLIGTPAIDSICAGDGNDRLTAVGQGDRLFGGGGDDVFDGAPGAWHAYAFGGLGEDTVTYERSDRRVIVCRTPTGYTFNVTLHAPTSMHDVERFVGTPYDDIMEGTDANETFLGRKGHDRLIGRGGNDRLLGGKGRDRFVTTDRRADVVRGGRGADRARADRRDRVYSAKRVGDGAFPNWCDL